MTPETEASVFQNSSTSCGPRPLPEAAESAREKRGRGGVFDLNLSAELLEAASQVAAFSGVITPWRR